MLTHHLAQSKNILPPLPKRWKTETFQNESGFYWRKWTWNVFNWSILRMITASYCRDYKLTIIILSLTLWWNGAYGKLRRFKNDYCLWLNCCQLPQSINLFFPTFLHSFRSSSWDDIFLLKEESFQTEKHLVLFDVRQFMVPFVTRLSQNCQAFQHDEVERMPFFTLFSTNGWDLIFLSRTYLIFVTNATNTFV